MTPEEELDAFIGFNNQMAEEEKRHIYPKCHFTNMSLEASDYEEWWECKHCGHTEEMKMLDRPF